MRYARAAGRISRQAARATAFSPDYGITRGRGSARRPSSRADSF